MNEELPDSIYTGIGYQDDILENNPFDMQMGEMTNQQNILPFTENTTKNQIGIEERHNAFTMIQDMNRLPTTFEQQMEQPTQNQGMQQKQQTYGFEQQMNMGFSNYNQSFNNNQQQPFNNNQQPFNHNQQQYQQQYQQQQYQQQAQQQQQQAQQQQQQAQQQQFYNQQPNNNNNQQQTPFNQQNYKNHQVYNQQQQIGEKIRELGEESHQLREQIKRLEQEQMRMMKQPYQQNGKQQMMNQQMNLNVPQTQYQIKQEKQEPRIIEEEKKRGLHQRQHSMKDEDSDSEEGEVEDSDEDYQEPQYGRGHRRTKSFDIRAMRSGSKKNKLRRTGAVRRKKGGWTQEEDRLLHDAIKKHGPQNWKEIAKHVPGKNHTQCSHRWQKVLHPGLIKGPWSVEEDNIILEQVKLHGTSNWTTVAAALPGRNGKQCRERYINHLDPTVKKGPWDDDELDILVSMQAELGNKWSQIAKHIPGRTDNACKNQFHAYKIRVKKGLKPRKPRKMKRLSIKMIKDIEQTTPHNHIHHERAKSTSSVPTPISQPTMQQQQHSSNLHPNMQPNLQQKIQQNQQQLPPNIQIEGSDAKLQHALVLQNFNMLQQQHVSQQTSQRRPRSFSLAARPPPPPPTMTPLNELEVPFDPPTSATSHARSKSDTFHIFNDFSMESFADASPLTRVNGYSDSSPTTTQHIETPTTHMVDDDILAEFTSASLSFNPSITDLMPDDLLSPTITTPTSQQLSQRHSRSVSFDARFLDRRSENPFAS